MNHPRIVIAGAGAIGCFVGGLLSAAGRDVTLLGRQWLQDEIAENGLTCTDFTGLNITSRPGVTTDPDILQDADIVLVCVKSGATADMAKLIEHHAPASAYVISLQNGVRNVATLKQGLPDTRVLGGMVGFNVVAMGSGRFHRSTSGEVLIDDALGALTDTLAVPALDLSPVPDIEAVQWGKLVLNLTNAVNALSDLPLRDMLLDPGWRRVMAAQIREALYALTVAAITVRVPAKAPGWAIPWILRLPTGLFRRVAAPMLTVDASARTSMVADLTAGRKTEIDEFQGEIIRLGTEFGIATPVNARVLAAIRAREDGDQSGAMSPISLLT